MMRLSDAAAVFNNTPFTDTDGLNPFKGQVLPFQDNVRSGITSTRRILETSPDVSPAEVVINTLTAEKYIVARPAYDQFRGANVRKKHPIIVADNLYSIKTMNQLLTGVGGQDIYVSVHYMRREPLDDSVNNTGGFLSAAQESFTTTAGNIMTDGTYYYRIVDDSYLDPIGLSTFATIRVLNAVRTLDVVTQGVYDPATETYSGGGTTPSTCFVEPRDKSYNYARGDFVKMEAGDVCIHTLTACSAGDNIGEYKVQASHVEDGVYVTHCRPL